MLLWVGALVVDKKFNSLFSLVYTLDTLGITKKQVKEIANLLENDYETINSLKNNNITPQNIQKVVTLATSINKILTNKQLTFLLYYGITKPTIKTSLSQKISLVKKYYSKDLLAIQNYKILSLVKVDAPKSESKDTHTSTNTTPINIEQCGAMVEFYVNTIEEIDKNISIETISKAVNNIKAVTTSLANLEKIPIIDIINAVLNIKTALVQVLQPTEEVKNFCSAVSFLAPTPYGKILSSLGESTAVFNFFVNTLDSLDKGKIMDIFLEYDRKIKTNSASGLLMDISQVMKIGYDKLSNFEKATLPQQLNMVIRSANIPLKLSSQELIAIMLDTAKIESYPPTREKEKSLNNIWKIMFSV